MAGSDVRSDTRVRPARPGDLAALARVRVESWHDAYRELIAPHNLARIDMRRSLARFRSHFAQPERGLLHVLESPEGIIGYVNSGPCREPELHGEIWELYVQPSAQGRGGGRRLLSAALWGLAEHGAIPAGLWVLSDNLRARRFYERMGGMELRNGWVEVGDQILSKTLYGWMTTLPWPDY